MAIHCRPDALGIVKITGFVTDAVGGERGRVYDAVPAHCHWDPDAHTPRDLQQTSCFCTEYAATNRCILPQLPCAQNITREAAQHSVHSPSTTLSVDLFFTTW